MKKVDNNIWEHGEYSVIKKYSPATKQYAYSIYKNGELIEIINKIKDVKTYIGGIDKWNDINLKWL